MRSTQDLRQLLNSLDGQGYRSYKRIAGAYDYGGWELRIDHVQGDPFADPSRLRALLPPALLLFYVLAVDRLGFLPAAAAMVLATALTFGARWRLAVPLAIAAPLLVHLVFYKLLRVPLPAGLLPAPWAAA